jgi:hypothetical protein
MMPQIMREMMPQFLEMMLPKMTNEQRMDFVLNWVTILMKQGCVGMPDEKKKDFMTQVEEKLKAN